MSEVEYLSFVEEFFYNQRIAGELDKEGGKLMKLLYEAQEKGIDLKDYLKEAKGGKKYCELANKIIISQIRIEEMIKSIMVLGLAPQANYEIEAYLASIKICGSDISSLAGHEKQLKFNFMEEE